jgi:hypothetical protein
MTKDYQEPTEEMITAACEVLFGMNVSYALRLHVRQAIIAALAVQGQEETANG